MRYRIPLLVGIVPLILSAGPDWTKLAAKYPQAMAVVEEARTTYEVSADGKYKSWTHYRATILKEPGIAQLAKYGDSYFEKYDQVSVKRAVVLSPAGLELPVDKDNIKDMPMPAFGPFYLQNVRLLLISFPHLEVGSTVEVEVEATRNAPPMDGQFALLEPLQREVPVLKQSVSVNLPASMPMTWKVYRGEASLTKAERDGRRTYEWQVADAPQLVEEPGMPPPDEVTPVLVASTIRDWKATSRWYYDMCKEGQKMTPALESLVTEVIKGKTSQEEQIQALFFWASKNIRYVETTMSGEKAGFKPVAAATTLERKYGVCRDKAQFLTTLLRQVGVDAYITLITSGVRRDVEVPNIHFNHAIVAIRRADKTFTFLDPTAEDSRQYLPFPDQDKFALVCTPEGEDIQATPVTPPQDNRMDIALDTTMTEDGSLASDVSLKPSGIYDFIFRNFLNQVAPAQREMIFKSIVGQVIPGANLANFRLTNLDDLTAPVRLSFSLSARNQGISAGAYLMLTTPGQGGRMDFLLRYFFGGASAEQRRFPLELPATMESRVHEKLKLPAGYTARSLPEAMVLQKGGASLSRSFVTTPEGLDYSEDLKVSDLYFSGTAYLGLRELLDQKDKLRDGKVILVRQGGAK